ncbi:tRNA uridine-5-carboxymethylaminomethyl(34) synthesis GTPase MnmE [bacterium]|nr:tRNA uridine-5-carboxymethylaminomethyl(34) synthesis GTPase MnmE [bacterium]
MTSRDTIMALASGAGRAGVAVLRASGPAARELCEVLTSEPAPADRKASLRSIGRPGAGGERIDQALVIFMPGPGSFTGEDVLELHIHGGRAVIDAVLAAAMDTGLCRPAEAGEFTRRAFEAGKLDLVQAEALADLIDAESEGQRRQAAAVLGGGSSRVFEAWRRDLLAALAALDASIDFPDEEGVPETVAERALEPARRLVSALTAALQTAARGRAVREGFRVAILGPPNAGKSSLLNRIARREAAIVSPVAGTTRDVVEVRLVMAGFPVWVADTAGLREASDAIEAEGVRRALERAEDADLRVWVLDASSPDPLAALPGPPVLRSADLVVLNKIDLGAGDALDDAVFGVSALSGTGVRRLEDAIERRVEDALAYAEPALITRERHAALVEAALQRIEAALHLASDGAGAELVAEELRLAARTLGRITGDVSTEDLLDAIFAEFCIGK